MKIENYDVALASSRVFEQQDKETEELRQWGKREEPENKNPGLMVGMLYQERVSISSQARLELASHIEQPQIDTGEEIDPEESVGFDSKLITLKKMIESITGKKIHLSHLFERGSGGHAYGHDKQLEAPPDAESSPPAETQPEQEWGMSYRRYESHYEYESTSFSANGQVTTADGKEISFSVNIEMSREYFSEEKLEINAGAPLIDPLVINYDGKAAELNDMRFEFDLNVDGNTEEINHLKPGSGFLVFDKNEDGIVNDGSELFGPTTGDGFRELSAYDEDKNNWIDENDSIFAKLALWRRETQTDYLESLKDAGVGAIYLGNEDTRFDLRNDQNDLYGRVQKTGVYLKETGEAGTIQQIDLSA